MYFIDNENVNSGDRNNGDESNNDGNSMIFDDTKAPGTIPQTGIGVGVAIAITTLFAIGIIIYSRLKRVKDIKWYKVKEDIEKTISSEISL